MKKKILFILKVLLFVSVGFFFTYWFISKLNPTERKEIISSFHSVHYLWFILAVLLNITSHIIRSLRWQLLLKPMGYTSRFGIAFSAVMTGYLANLAIPRLGELVRCAILHRYDKIPVEKSLGTVVSERIIDLLVFGLAVLLLIFVEMDALREYVETNLTTNLSSSSKIWFLGLGTAFVFILVLLYLVFKKQIRRSWLFLRLKKIVLGFWEGIYSVLKLKRPFLFVFYSLLIWFLYFLSTYAIFFCLTETSQLSLKAALVSLVLGAIGNMFSPGGIGLYPYLFSKSLSLYAIPSIIGYALGWISWASQQIGCLLLGFYSLIALSLKKNANTSLNRE